MECSSLSERTMNKISKRCSACENSGSWACDTKLSDSDVENCLFWEPNKRCELDCVDLNLKFGRMARPRYKAKLIERAKALRTGQIINLSDAVEALALKVA